MNLSMNTITRLLGAVTAALTLCVISPSVLAGPILANDGIVYIEKSPSVLGTTAVTDPGGNPVSSIAHNSGHILLEDYAGNALTTYVPPDPPWWNAPGVAYTTTTSGIFIDFVDMNVTGFTFNIGANANASAWIKAYYNDGVGHELSTGWFGGVGPSSTPSFGVYVNDPLVSCAQITRIEIDPTFEWGVGNFGVAESSCASVPAPTPDTLLSMGLLAMGMSHMLWLKRNRRPRVVPGVN